jgi:multidrug efflux pump subunit AcrA (membrane-fusion protein)
MQNPNGSTPDLYRAASRLCLVAVLAVAVLTTLQPAHAGLQVQAGPYRVELTANPPVIRLGKATLLLKVTDASGRPVQGARVRVLAQMPGMSMGEREETALPQAGQPGVYAAPAQFGMEGGYNATVKVSGAQGEGTAIIPLKTGQNMAASPANRSPAPLLLALLGLVVVLFVAYRMWRTGQRPNLRALLSRQFLVGAGLLLLTFLGASWAVKKYTAPGHMSVVDAQGMDMSVMKPPVGAVPVAAMAAKRQTIESTVTYTGSAVSFVDQDVYPRVTGNIAWMAAYPGQRVRRGQLIARLDSAELASKANEQAANRAMAEHTAVIARLQYQQSLGAKGQGEAQVMAARGAVSDALQGRRKAQAALKGAQTDLEGSRSEAAAAEGDAQAANEERATAQADLEAAQTQVPDAQAQLAAARADQQYQGERLRRSQVLLTSGAVSQEEYDQDRAMAENAAAKVRQAQARIEQVNAAVRGAQSRIKKADAMLAASRARASQMQAKIQGSQAKIEEAQADIAGADAKIGQAKAVVEAAQANARALAASSKAAQHEIAHTEAGVRQAEAQLTTAQVVKGYTEIRAAVDGMVTQRLVGPGTLVAPGQAILKISQISPIRLQANVAESDLEKIRVGNRVRVRTTGSGRVLQARVASIFPAVDPTARTGIVEVILSNRDGKFLPGQYVTMDLTTAAARNALVVPSGAMVWQAQAASPDAVLATSETPKVWTIQAGEPEKTVYTCTMHPEVKQDKPGKCPI